MTLIIRICMLNADVPVPNVFAQRAPTYGHIFHLLLAQASPNVTIQSTDFDVTRNEYPTSLDDYDVIVVSGSANSAYDDLPWVQMLDNYIRDVYTHHLRIKIFGSCFGHQLICQSLLKDYGVKIEADPNGWEIGVKEVTLHNSFREAFGKSLRTSFDDINDREIGEKMRLQFVHHDHVVIPTPNALPPTWVTFGSTEHCAVQGVYEPGRILTLQGHFEFDRFVNSECIKHFFAPIWKSQRLNEALEAIDADDDSEAAARMVLRFLFESGDKRHRVSHAVVRGILTPPLEA